jgi:hypothetical protein
MLEASVEGLPGSLRGDFSKLEKHTVASKMTTWGLGGLRTKRIE